MEEAIFTGNGWGQALEFKNRLTLRESCLLVGKKCFRNLKTVFLRESTSSSVSCTELTLKSRVNIYNE